MKKTPFCFNWIQCRQLIWHPRIKYPDFVSCGIRMNFINVVECCLQQILHDVGTLVNTASAIHEDFYLCKKTNKHRILCLFAYCMRKRGSKHKWPLNTHMEMHFNARCELTCCLHILIRNMNSLTLNSFYTQASILLNCQLVFIFCDDCSTIMGFKTIQAWHCYAKNEWDIYFWSSGNSQLPLLVCSSIVTWGLLEENGIHFKYNSLFWL